MIKIAAIALRGMTILPGTIAHFDISRDKSIKAVEAAMNNNQRIFLVTQRDAEVDNPKMADLFEVGLVATWRPKSEYITDFRFVVGRYA